MSGDGSGETKPTKRSALGRSPLFGGEPRSTRGGGSKRALARGIGSLIPTEGRADAPARVNATRVPLDAITINPEQPRRRFDQTELMELTASVKRHGIISPLLVRQVGRGYVLIAGERRLRAARGAGLTEVPVLVRLGADDAVLQLELALVENLQRADLDAIDAALGYQRLIDEFGHTQAVVATAVGKDRSTIANAVRLLRLPEAVLTAVREGQLSAGHARALLPLVAGDDAEHPGLAEAIETASTSSVRATEALVRRLLQGDDAPSNPALERSQAARPVARQLTTALAAEVSIKPRKRGGGRIVIDYTSPDELARLVARLS